MTLLRDFGSLGDHHYQSHSDHPPSARAEVPDPTFLHLDPLEITFPPLDRAALVRGDQRGAAEALSVDKYVSQDQ